MQRRHHAEAQQQVLDVTRERLASGPRRRLSRWHARRPSGWPRRSRSRKPQQLVARQAEDGRRHRHGARRRRARGHAGAAGPGRRRRWRGTAARPRPALGPRATQPAVTEVVGQQAAARRPGARSWPKHGSRAATAMRVPGAQLGQGPPSLVGEERVAAVVRTTRPRRVRTSNTGFSPSSTNADGVATRRRPSAGRATPPAPTPRPSPAGGARPRSPARRWPGRARSVSQAMHLPIDGPGPDHVEGGGLQAGQQLVEVDEARWACR